MNAIKYFTCIVLLALTSRIYSQMPDTIWTKTFGGPLADVGNSVKQTNDGGFIVAATTSSFGAGGQDIYLIKTDENGDTLWTKKFGGTGNDRAANVVQTNDNGFAVFGTTNSYGNGRDDFLLWKTNLLGNSEWYKIFDYSYDVKLAEGTQTFDNGYIFIGNDSDPMHKARVIKTDSLGNEMWNKIIFVGIPTLGYSVTQTLDSGYAVCGFYYFWIGGDYQYKSYLYKLTSTGDSLLIKTYDFTIREKPFVIRNTYDGNLILAGITGTYGEKSRLLKVTQDGDIIWTKEITGTYTPAYLNSLEQDFDNGLIFTIIPYSNPSFDPDFELIKCDLNGDLLWKKRVGGPQFDYARSVYPTIDSGYIVTGETKSFGAGDNDVWLMKFNYPTPINVQINFYPPVDTALVNGGCTTPEIICKNLNSTNERDSISIEPGFNTYFYYYDSTGTQIPLDNYYFIVIDSLDEYDYELWFHPKSYPPFKPVLIKFDSIFYSEQNKYDIQLIVKKNGMRIDSLSQPFHADFGLSVDDSGIFPNEFILSQNYPNPFNPSTKIEFRIADFGFVSLKIYDILGNEIVTLVNEEKQPGTYEVEFKASSGIRELVSGIYFYQLKAGDYVETKKMILIK